MNIRNEDITLLIDKIGLNYNESRSLLYQYDGDIEATLSAVKYFGDSLTGAVLAKQSINQHIKNAGVYKKLVENLSKYNTCRGGVKGFKGFVFEELHATDATVNGQTTKVICDNGIADFKMNLHNGKIVNGQAKIGYKNQHVDWSKYNDQVIVIDKGNKYLRNQAKQAGCDVIESNISEKEAKSLASKMQVESKLTGRTTSKVVPKMYSSEKIIQQCHESGISAAKNGAAFGAGFSIGSNFIDVIDGKKELGEAAIDVTTDTVISAGTSYVVGAVTTAAANTAIGSAAIGAASTAGTAIASTAIGSATIGAATATTAATTAGTVVAGTAIGAAAVAAAPVVIAGIALGGIFAIGKALFGED